MSASLQRPSAGKRIRVTRGKRKGVEGRVEIHQLSKFGKPYRYGSEASNHMKDLVGRSGWVCLIRTDAGESFWIDADKTEVLS